MRHLILTKFQILPIGRKTLYNQSIKFDTNKKSHRIRSLWREQNGTVCHGLDFCLSRNIVLFWNHVGLSHRAKKLQYLTWKSVLHQLVYKKREREGKRRKEKKPSYFYHAKRNAFLPLNCRVLLDTIFQGSPDLQISV